MWARGGCGGGRDMWDHRHWCIEGRVVDQLRMKEAGDEKILESLVSLDW